MTTEEPTHDTFDHVFWNVVSDRRGFTLLILWTLFLSPLVLMALLPDTMVGIAAFVWSHDILIFFSLLLYRSRRRWLAYRRWVLQIPTPKPNAPDIHGLIDSLIRRDKTRNT